MTDEQGAPASGAVGLRRTYRSWLTSSLVAVWLGSEATLAVLVVLLAGTFVGLPERAIPVGLCVSVAFALWRAVRLSVTCVGPTAVVRNPWRTYRIERVVRLDIGHVARLKGVACLTFEGEDGRVVKVVTTAIWFRGIWNERSGRTIRRLDDVISRWAEATLPRSGRSALLRHESLRDAAAARNRSRGQTS